MSILGQNRVATIFDKTALLAFQTTADARGVDPSEMITEALVKLPGPIVASPIRA